MAMRGCGHFGQFDLSHSGGRRDLLWALSESGAGALEAAAIAVWSQLASPRGRRCAAIAQLAGATGSGRVALCRVLGQFLSEMERIEPGDLPDIDCFESIADWHAACSLYFAEADDMLSAVVAKYDFILDGHAPPN